MPYNFYMTFRGRIRGEKYKSLHDLVVAYEGVKVQNQPTWTSDEAGALALGAEPKGFERPTENRPFQPNLSAGPIEELRHDPSENSYKSTDAELRQVGPSAPRAYPSG